MKPISVAFSGQLGSFAMEVGFTVPATGVTCLEGPSGTGKTSVLRGVAGLHRFTGGTCVVGDAVWQRGDVFMPPWRRAVGYVFQEGALFAHLGVRGNLRYAMRDQAGFDDVVALLGLEGLVERRIQGLSGGERQRVAVARALLSDPVLMLMDEPFSALDGRMRQIMAKRLRAYLTGRGIAALYVTHDAAEQAAIADRVVTMPG